MGYLLPWILSIILILIPAYYRSTWNDPIIALGSDPQIKYYQAVQMHQKGFSLESFECIYPAKELGFSIQNLPFGYPWAFLVHSKCFFQYPFLFSLVQYLLGGFWKTEHIVYIPILFFFVNFWIVFFILKYFELTNLFASCLSFVLHGLTPVFLSALDYSELTLTNFLVCVFLYLIKEVDTESIPTPLILGGILAFNFQLRPESTIGLVFFLVFYFLFSKEYSKNFYFFFYIAFSFLIVTGFFAFFNFVIYENPLGLRGLNTLQDASSGFVRDYFYDWKTDLFGSDFKIGLFQGFPILFVFVFFIFFIRKISSSFSRSLLLSGLLFILFLPILSPYRAGVDIFGMRYFETGIYLMGIGFAIGSRELLIRYPAKFPYIIIIVALWLSYYSYKSILRAIKHWNSGAVLSHELYREFQSIQPDLVVHKGVSTSYLLGLTYLDFPQVAIFTKEEWKNVEQIAHDKKLKRILLLEWKENSLFNKEIPTKIWEAQFAINFEIVPKTCTLLERRKIIHFDGSVYECE